MCDYLLHRQEPSLLLNELSQNYSFRALIHFTALFILFGYYSMRNKHFILWIKIRRQDALYKSSFNLPFANDKNTRHGCPPKQILSFQQSCHNIFCTRVIYFLAYKDMQQYSPIAHKITVILNFRCIPNMRSHRCIMKLKWSTIW